MVICHISSCSGTSRLQESSGTISSCSGKFVLRYIMSPAGHVSFGNFIQVEIFLIFNILYIQITRTMYMSNISIKKEDRNLCTFNKEHSCFVFTVLQHVNVHKCSSIPNLKKLQSISKQARIWVYKLDQLISSLAYFIQWVVQELGQSCNNGESIY